MSLRSLLYSVNLGASSAKTTACWPCGLHRTIQSSIPNGLSILAEHAVNAADLNKEDLAKRIQDAKEDVADAKDDHAKAAAADYLDQLTTLQAAL